MRLYCRKYNIPVTKELELLLDQDLHSEKDGEPHVPEGFYTISDGEYFTGSEGQLLIYCSDLINCTYHPDKTRLNGCCGLSGLDGPNRVWMGFYNNKHPHESLGNRSSREYLEGVNNGKLATYETLEEFSTINSHNSSNIENLSSKN